uniref:Annexin n=1 Tax=Callorhinchus milii TaxID=7868 RepID=V9KRW9_CALMI|eukprot:gi/632972694/ref/XP_007902785.1/ PREDICTED: annexin A4-like isoform X1 [Callorhinchus milii]
MAAKCVARSTIKPFPGFNSEDDADTLHSAMKGLGTDEDDIINILTSRNNAQRQHIIKAYSENFGKDLIDDLKSELGGHLESIIEGLMLTPAVYDAMELKNSMNGVGTDEETLAEILTTRTNNQICDIVATYRSEYESNLKEDIESESSSDFEDFLVTLLKGKRDETYYVDQSLVQKDVAALRAAGEDKWGTDEKEFIKILCRRNFFHLRAVFEAYDQQINKDIEDTIQDEMSGSMQMGILTLIQYVKNPAGFFAKKLYDSMKGCGTADKILIRVMISRSEIDMQNIKEEFTKLCGKTLAEFIQDDIGGDYQKVLLRLCGVDEEE